METIDAATRKGAAAVMRYRFDTDPPNRPSAGGWYVRAAGLLALTDDTLADLPRPWPSGRFALRSQLRGQRGLIRLPVYPALTRGTVRVLQANGSGAGAIAPIYEKLTDALMQLRRLEHFRAVAGFHEHVERASIAVDGERHFGARFALRLDAAIQFRQRRDRLARNRHDDVAVA